MVYQINSSKLFLTYPQCTLTKEDVRDYLQQKFNPSEIIVASELHTNGDPHIHAYLSLKDTFRTRDSRFADLPGGFHGNYQGCRSAKSVIKYCTKEDDYTGNVDVASVLGKSKRSGVLGELILGKRTLLQVVDDNPQYLYGYSKLKADYLNYLKDKEDGRLELPPFLPNPWGKVLPSKRNSKRRHYWIFSRQPDKGKSYLFARPLSQEYKCHHRTSNEPYYNIRGDEQCLILDEYNFAKFKFHELNAIADGTYDYRIFHGGVVRLKDPLIIVLSNVSISELYPHMNHLLYARFIEYELV